MVVFFPIFYILNAEMRNHKELIIFEKLNMSLIEFMCNFLKMNITIGLATLNIYER